MTGSQGQNNRAAGVICLTAMQQICYLTTQETQTTIYTDINTYWQFRITRNMHHIYVFGRKQEYQDHANSTQKDSPGFEARTFLL